MRARIADKRVCGLVKALLNAGIMSEHGGLEPQLTGTPQGGILSPTHHTTVLFNPGGVRTTRYRYRGKNIPTPWEQEMLALREPTLPLERLEGLIAR